MKSNVDITKQSIINKVMTRRNKLKKKKFYEQLNIKKM